MAESLRILILEDNPADAELIRLELQEAGITFTSEVVITEGEYLQAIQDCRPDLILSDYDLPTYNGALALAEARKRCPDTPFILVTGAVTEDRAIDVLTQGARDYVLKNRLEQRLVPAVKRALAEAEEHQARKHAEAELLEANRTLEERVKTRTAELEAEVAVRKKIADALQMSERRERERAEELAIILDAVPTPVILVHDPDSTHMTGNRSADELLRQQRGSETSLSAPPEVKPRHFKAFKGGRELKLDELPAQRAARGEHVKDFDFSLVFDDGATRYLLGYGTPLLDKLQRPRGAVHVLVDITERKLAEDALRLNAAIIETVAEGIFLIGLDDNIIKWTNRKFEQLFGYGPGEMVGMHVDKVNAPTERTPTETRISIVDVLRQAGEYHGEIESIRKDGTHFWSYIHVSLFNHPEFGTVMVSAHTDITERKRAEDDLKRKTADLESAVAELDSFTYSVSHDLRAPLRAIDAFSRILLKEAPDRLDPEDARKLRMISRNSEKMGLLIDDLLKLSRTGRVEIRFDQLNMKSVVEDVWREILAGNPDRNMEIIIGDLPPAWGDRTLLRQVFSNLLGNAVKFTKNRDKAVIDVTCLNAAEFNTYCVRDNGVGFDMEYYDKLFEIFRRLHSESQYEGTGVGLVIVKKIIERHGGRIWAESKPSEGAAFYFNLPAVINPQG